MLTGTEKRCSALLSHPRVQPRPGSFKTSARANQPRPGSFKSSARANQPWPGSYQTSAIANQQWTPARRTSLFCRSACVPVCGYFCHRNVTKNPSQNTSYSWNSSPVLQPTSNGLPSDELLYMKPPKRDKESIAKHTTSYPLKPKKNLV